MELKIDSYKHQDGSGKETFFASVEDEEYKGTIGIGNGIRNAIKELGISIGILEEYRKTGKKPSAEEGFKELKKLIGPYWDKVSCICSVLGKDRCHLNCPDYKE